MYRNTINFNKYQLPETFNVTLSGIDYEAEIWYNHVNDRLYITLRDENGEDLITSEKLVAGERLFAGVNDENLPREDLVMIDETGKSTVVNFANVNRDIWIAEDDTFPGELDPGNTDEGIFNPDGDETSMDFDADETDEPDDDDDLDELDDLDLIQSEGGGE
ncbi:hypothetical protein EFR94_09545 [Levilactobacillus brevis]|uniref:Cyanophage baseplate Pam3 plug gp18 domain-containing protein n=1 Tax=Levilactobacillus brevis TaxID=1580 RepID=A0A2A3TXT2_LEVBR|nr:hypothetical protein [Levilactobacillus brevis]MCT3567628.1 hypothetical protein [Levilactobacillus brevis]PBQ23832.1 hypothetical protein CNR29_07305 [Levilactobacillus brevis]